MPRLRRVYQPGLPRNAGASVVLESGEAHHVSRVLRLAPGDTLFLFDGRGAEWEGVVESCGRGGVTVRLKREIDEPVEAELEVDLFQALCRPDRMDWVLQKGTEVGVAGIHGWVTKRVEVAAPSPARVERWRRIVAEAAKQCGRRQLPTVDLVPALPHATQRDTLAVLLDPARGVTPLARVLRERAARRVWLAVGPEGGFTSGERDRWEASGWVRAGLGPRILRTESAGVIAAAIVLHRWGDLGNEAGV